MKTKKEKICIVVAVMVTLVVTALVVVAGVRNKHKNDVPDTPPVNGETVDTSGETDTSDPNIPVIDPSTGGGEDEHPNDNPGEVHIDVEKPDGAPKPKEPYVEGEIIIIPGIKEVDENETQN